MILTIAPDLEPHETEPSNNSANVRLWYPRVPIREHQRDVNEEQPMSGYTQPPPNTTDECQHANPDHPAIDFIQS